MIKDLSNFLLVTDLDGTLLPSDKILSQKDLTAIEKFRSAGGKFTIATGRTVKTAETYFNKLKPDTPCILFNGAVLFDANKYLPISQEQLPLKALEIINEVCSEFPDIACEILTLYDTYVVQNNEVEDKHVQLCQVTPVYTTANAMPHNVWIKALFAGNPQKMPEVIKFIDDKNYNDVDFVKSADIFYEMLPKNCSKGNALKKLITQLNPNDYTVIAAGDYHNDISMLETADFGAATANAQQEVKNSAKIILNNTNNQDAISELIERIFNNDFASM